VLKAALPALALLALAGCSRPAAPAEAMAAAGDAEAAASVVKTYYLLLESGRTEAAAKLRGDLVREDQRSLQTLNADVGTPGPVQGAAGSLQVEVPVVLYGRLAGGAEYRRSGRVSLRRAGPAGDQGMWKIDRIQLEP
jgi:peptidoglycan hydrolase-like protein with peptidoglycan-binding domain